MEEGVHRKEMEIASQLFINSIIAGAIYTMIALGFNLIFGAVRFFDMGFGALTAVGAYSVFFVTREIGGSVMMGVLAGIVVAGLVGHGAYRMVYAPLRKRKASDMVLLVASLGVFTVLQAVIAMLFTNQFRVLSQSAGLERTFHIGGGVITETQSIIFGVGVFVSLALFLLLSYTLFGKQVRAIGDDEEAAVIVGINTSRIIGTVFFVGSAIAGLAGILVGYDTGIEPTMGLGLLLKGVIASIIGGVGNVYGGVAGAFLLGFAENFGIWKISGEWKDAIAFALLIVVLLVRPKGIFQR